MSTRDSFSRSRVTVSPTASSTSTRDLEALRARLRLEHVDDLPQEIADRDLLRMEVALARFELGEVQDVVDHAEQASPRSRG